MSMRLRLVAITSVVLAGCASFEPRVSVHTEEAQPARAGRPSAVPKPKTQVATDYTVARGDTLYGIAFRNKLDFRDLAAWNNINAPYTIYPGQGLRLKPPSRTTRVTDLPPTTATATPPPASPSAPPSTAPSPQVEIDAVPTQPVHTPELAASDSGATQTFAMVDDSAPASTPLTTTPVDPPPPEPVAPPPPKPVATTPAAATNSPAAAIGLPSTAPKPAEAVPAPTAVGAVPVAPVADTTPRAVVDANAPTRERDGLRWRWPANGNVVGRFVEGDPTQQGIDIGGSLGHTVLAAADGDVVYSGNGLLGYGELVIVQHSPGYLSAYGHNQKRLVVEGAKVKAGQPIAEMGRRGGIDMLHFEIRRNGKPVDPLGYLPSR